MKIDSYLKQTWRFSIANELNSTVLCVFEGYTHSVSKGKKDEIWSFHVAWEVCYPTGSRFDSHKYFSAASLLPFRQ